MNRRTFIKISGAAAIMGALAAFNYRFLEPSEDTRKFLSAVKIKKYIGRTRLMGTEIGEEGKWLG